MKYFINIVLASAFLTVILFQGCDDTINQTEVDNDLIPDSNVSYVDHIFPVFNAKCSTAAGCHSAGDRAGGISLQSWSDVVADFLVVTPGEPNSSKLVWSIEGRAGVEPMPPLGFPRLTNNQIDGIKTWIAEGAKNN